MKRVSSQKAMAEATIINLTTSTSAPRPGSTKLECAGSPPSNDGMTWESSGFSFATPGAMSLSSRGFSAQTIAARFTQDL